MNVLRKLLAQLGIDERYLVITDFITGAGYIAKGNYVFCRWGYIQEGVATLSAYVEAAERQFDTEITPSNRGWQHT